MVFHNNRSLLADNSHVIAFTISFKNEEIFHKNLSSAAVVIGALDLNINDA